MNRIFKRIELVVFATIFSFLLFETADIAVRAEEGSASGVLEEDTLGAKSYKVGDIIKFGHYEQDGNTANGKEEIEWEVLKVESDRVLVASKYALDCKKYNETNTDVTWETCTLRKWLNNDFKNTAFTSTEQSRIPIVKISNKDNSKWNIAGGNDTQDQVFCLSLDEAKDLIGYNVYDSTQNGYSQKMLIEASQYAINNGANFHVVTENDYFWLKWNGYSADVIGRRGSEWWLRSPGSSSWYACYVGSLGYWGQSECNFVGSSGKSVRPTMYIFTSKVNPNSISLDRKSATLYYGNIINLIATLTPSNVTERSITWTSSNPSVATVNNGTVKATGKQAGTTTITAKTVNGLTAKCEVTVYADNNSSNIFADIKYGNWQYNAAKAVYDKGYMTGKGKVGKRVLFSPNTDINRSQFVVSLYAMAGNPKVTYKQQFSDVKSSDWYANAVTWASNNGIVSGYTNGKFGVNDKATREQLALMLYKYAQYNNYDVSIKASTNLDGFTDKNKVDSWAVTAIKWAVERGIISGKGNATEGYRLDPTKGASRIECAAMMNRFDEVYSCGEKMAVEEELEEPIALPEEEIEDLPAADEEIEDIADEDIVDDEDVVDEEDSIEEEDAVPGDEDMIDDEDTDSEEDIEQ